MELGNSLRRAASKAAVASRAARSAQLNEYGTHGEAAAVATSGEGLVWAGVARS